MKKIFLVPLLLLSILMITCKPEPMPGEDDDNSSNDTLQETPLVRKYLVRECRATGFGFDNPSFIIDWNDDFTRIEHITTDSGTYNQVEYDFDYYAEDSMKVSVYIPNHTSKTNYICHMKDGKITKMDFYYCDTYEKTIHRTYNDDGKLISSIDSVHNCGTIFEWDGDNVVRTYSYPNGENAGTTYNNFGKHIHPYYTQPHWLPGYGSYAGFSYGYITQPFWKNFGTCSERGCYEYDSDGYVTYSYHITEEGTHVPHARYEYDY